MAYTPLDLTSAGKSFDKAFAALIRAKDDPNDPTSHNLAVAIGNYFTALGEANVEIARGLNDLLDRVDKIQAKFGIK